MVFLVGAQRSGTNWLQRMLAVHPDIASLPSETQLFSYGLARLTEVVHHGVVTSPSTTGLFMNPDAFHDALRDFCDTAFGELARLVKPDATYVLERSPHHALVLDLIGAVYPDAQVVHIIRDGRDVVRSQLAQSYGPDTVASATREWRRTVITARASAHLVRTYVEVRYETLLADPRTGLADLFGQLGIETDDAVLDAAVAESGEMFNVDTTDPRLGAGKWQDSWTRKDVAEFLAEAGPLVSEFGVEAAPGAVPRAARRTRLIRPARRRRPERPAALDALEKASRVVDDFLSALATGRDRDVAARTTDDVDVRVIDASGERQASGAPGRALLLAAVIADDVSWGDQVRGTVHPGTPMFTVVLTHRGSDGEHADRVLVVRPNGEAIGKVTYYRFPLAP